MKKDLQSQIDNERREHAERVKNMLTEFKQDMQTVESTYRRKSSESTELASKLEQKHLKQQKVIDELKNLLQITVKSDQRKDALLQETKVAFQAERDKIAARMKEVDMEKNTLDEFKKTVR